MMSPTRAECGTKARDPTNRFAWFALISHWIDVSVSIPTPNTSFFSIKIIITFYKK